MPESQRLEVPPTGAAGHAVAGSPAIEPRCARQWAGVLRMRVEEKSGRSYAAHQFHEGALRVLRPHYLDDSGQVTYTVINPGGAYFGADEYLLELDLRDRSALVLSTQSATKVYKTPQGPAEQTMIVRLGAESVLEYVPDQLIVYRDGSYVQRTVVEMDPSASLAMAEIVTPGWSPTGDPFTYDKLSMRAEVRVLSDEGSRRLVVDQLRVKPGEHAEVTGMGFMEGHSHTGQLLLVDRRLDDEVYEQLTALVDASATHSGITRAGRDHLDGVRCVCIRSLADSTEHIAALHREVIDLLRGRWRGQPPLDLRKP